MSAVMLLARREIGTYLNTWLGWTVLAVTLILDGLFFNAIAVGDSPRYSAEVLETFFFWSSGIHAIAGVLLSMRLLAEEQQSGTLVVLQTAPIGESQIVLGKFLGALGFLGVITLLSAYMPAMIFVNGKVAIAHIAVGYLGMMLFGASAVAVGTYGSSLTRFQILAALLGGGILGFLVISWYLARITDDPLSPVLAYMAIWDRHFQPFMRGRLNTESVVYMLSVCFGFLLLATRSLQSRRWQ